MSSEDIILLSTPRISPSPPSPLVSLPTSTAHTPTNTPLSRLLLSLPCVLDFEQFRIAAEAEPRYLDAALVKTCTYIEKRKPLVPHRCLVVDICLGEEGHLWVRLDRRPTSAFALASTKGKTSSNDEVTSARTVRELSLGKYELENAQVFNESPPTLRDLVQVLRAFATNATKYKLWSENCWFLCSVVEGLLLHEGNGLYIAGHHRTGHWAMRSRRRIAASFAAHKQPERAPTTVGSPTDSLSPSSLSFQGAPTAIESRTRTRQGCTHRNFVEQCATDIAVSLRGKPAPWTPSVNRERISLRLRRECGIMLRQVHWDNDGHYANHLLAGHLFHYGEILCYLDQNQEALEVLGRSVQMTRTLHHHRPGRYLVDLPRRLELLSRCNQKLGYKESACTSLSEAVVFSRQLDESKADGVSTSLPLTLKLYGDGLNSLGLHQQACNALAESVAITRRFYERDSMFAFSLVGRLRSYANYLRQAGKYFEACKAQAEVFKISGGIQFSRRVDSDCVHARR